MKKLVLLLVTAVFVTASVVALPQNQTKKLNSKNLIFSSKKGAVKKFREKRIAKFRRSQTSTLKMKNNKKIIHISTGGCPIIG